MFEEVSIFSKIKVDGLSRGSGAYDARRKEALAAIFSSAGPTRDGRLKPEMSAPGHEVEAANASILYFEVPHKVNSEKLINSGTDGRKARLSMS